MVRDDFWLAVSRFMQALEVRPVEGENSRLVDLFDLRHARKGAGGVGPRVRRSAGVATARTSRKRFSIRPSPDLAQEGKVIRCGWRCLPRWSRASRGRRRRCAKSAAPRAWAWRFSRRRFPRPPPRCTTACTRRPRGPSWRPCCRKPGTDIKGHMRSREGLLSAAGCEVRPPASMKSCQCSIASCGW